MLKKISSLQNSEVKWLLQLQEKSRNRRKENAFMVEGQREIEMAFKGGYEPINLYYVPEMISFEEVMSLSRLNPDHGAEITELSEEVYQKLAYRSSTEGLLAVFRIHEIKLEDLKFQHKNPLILIAEAPEKPGNIGAILRTADAANVDAVIIANPKTDLYNPNIIRSSVGCVFTNQICMGSTKEIIDYLNSEQIKIYSASLQNSQNYLEVDFTGPSAIVLGTEATGLSNDWIENATQNILIPMEGEIDSMNVSVAAGILIFEAKRQRTNLKIN